MITPRENVILAMEHRETLWIPNCVTDCDIVLQSAIMERYEGKETGFDEFGVEYEFNAEANGPVMRPGTRRFREIEEWRDFAFPDVVNRDWEAAAARDTANWDRENRFSIVQLFNGMFERAHMMMGFEDTLCALLTEPEEMEGFFSAFTDYRIQLIQHIARYYKPDAIMVFDDYGAKESMMMSPETWRELIKPQLRRLIEATHACGMYYILHCCGYFKPIFPDIVELGADAVHPIQVMNNPPELKALYGDKICFCGGFDNVGIIDREDATEEEVRKEVRRVIKELAPGGSFLAWRSFFCSQPEAYMDELMKFIRPQFEKLNKR